MNSSTLKRGLNLPLLTLYGLGTILGAGIYVLVGKVAGIAGMYAPLTFLISAILAAFTGYSYAKLSVRFPKSAGEVIYIDRAFSNRRLSSIVGWLVILTGTVSSATLVNGFIGYLSAFIDSPENLSIFLLVIAITLLACWGITESVGIAAAITCLEIVGLLIVLWVLRGEFNHLPERLPELMPPASKELWGSIFLGAFLAFYAFIGFEDMVNVAEEVITPERTLPLAIFIALAVSSLLYIAISLVSVLALPLHELSASESPMISLLETKNSSTANVVGLISLVAVINGALIQIIMGARVLYGMSINRLAPQWFSIIHTKTQTPIRATFTIAIIIWFFAIALPLVALAKLTSFIILIIFTLVNSSLLIITLRDQNTKTLLSFKLVIPALGAVFCLTLLAIQLNSLL